MKETLQALWPIAALVIFTLGGYAYMIRSIAEKVKVLFGKSKEQGDKINDVEIKSAVVDERIKNLCSTAEKQQLLLTSILNKLQATG